MKYSTLIQQNSVGEDRMKDHQDNGSDAVRDQVKNSAEFAGFTEELMQRLPAFARQAAAVPHDSKGSVEWIGKIGKFWWVARERVGLSRYEVAERMKVSANQIRFLEFGLAKPEELSSKFLYRYAEALGKPELYEEFRRTFKV